MMEGFLKPCMQMVTSFSQASTKLLHLSAQRFKICEAQRKYKGQVID